MNEYEQYQREQQILAEAQWIIDNDATVRDTGMNFMMSKSTVHRDMRVELKHLSLELYDQVDTILKRHLKESTRRMRVAKRQKRDRTN